MDKYNKILIEYLTKRKIAIEYDTVEQYEEIYKFVNSNYPFSGFAAERGICSFYRQSDCGISSMCFPGRAIDEENSMFFGDYTIIDYLDFKCIVEDLVGPDWLK